MPQKRIPTPTQDAGNWGTILNDHLAQTQNPLNGAFNSYTSKLTRPILTADDSGYTGINKSTGDIEQWNGTIWESLTSTGKIHYCDVIYSDPSNVNYYLTQSFPSNPDNDYNSPKAHSIDPDLLPLDYVLNQKTGLLYKRDDLGAWQSIAVSEDFTVINKFTMTAFRKLASGNSWQIVSPNGIINVRDWGARADAFGGVNYGHDDTGSIQAAMNYAASTWIYWQG